MKFVKTFWGIKVTPVSKNCYSFLDFLMKMSCICLYWKRYPNRSSKVHINVTRDQWSPPRKVGVTFTICKNTYYLHKLRIVFSEMFRIFWYLQIVNNYHIWYNIILKSFTCDCLCSVCRPLVWHLWKKSINIMVILWIHFQQYGVFIKHPFQTLESWILVIWISSRLHRWLCLFLPRQVLNITMS